MIHEHENTFMKEIYDFVQPHAGQVGVYMIIRLPGGEFVHQEQECTEKNFRQNIGAFDHSCHELMTQLIAVARRGPSSADILLMPSENL